MAALTLWPALLLATGLGMSAPSPSRAWAGFIAEASARFGVPVPWIERVMMAESRGQTRLGGYPIRSKAGAIGLMQLMPQTWIDMRADYHFGANPDDPHDNILAGAAYLRILYDRFGYPGMFAAYNAGPARYVDYLAGRSGLSSETRDYLAKVSAPAGPIPTRSVSQLLFALRHDGDATGTLMVPTGKSSLFVVVGPTP